VRTAPKKKMADFVPQAGLSRPKNKRVDLALQYLRTRHELKVPTARLDAADGLEPPPKKVPRKRCDAGQI